MHKAVHFGTRPIPVIFASVASLLTFHAAEAAPIFTTLQDPLATGYASGAGYTLAWGINDAGQIVGSFVGETAQDGFLYNGSGYTTLSDPGAVDGTVATGINNLGQIVGFFQDSAGDHGFLYSGSTWVTLDDPDAAPGETQVYGINDLGEIVGSFASGPNESLGFVFNGSTFTTIGIPFAFSTNILGINDLGQITGYYADSFGDLFSFVCNSVAACNGGSESAIEDPNAAPFSTVALGINNLGQVVGYYTDASGAAHGFEYNGSTYITIDPPGSAGFSQAFGIDNLGQVSGDYIDASFNEYGYLFSPAVPEPPSLTLLSVALAAGLCCRCFVRRSQ